MPEVIHADVSVVDVALSAGHLPSLLRAIRRGRIEQGLLPGVPSIALAWPPKTLPDLDDPADRTSPAAYDRPYSEWRSCFEITARPGSPSEWVQGSRARYDYLRGLDQRFETLGYGRLNVVGMKLGLIPTGTGEFSDSTPGLIQLVAPLPARIEFVRQDRDHDTLLVATEVARTYPPGRLSVRLVEPTGKLRREVEVRVGARRIVRFKRLVPGEAHVLLLDKQHGIIGRRHGRIRSPMRLRPRWAALNLVDPKLDRIRADLRSTKAHEHERGVALSLQLIGYSPAWWGRGMSLPAGHQSGSNAADIIAASADDRTFLVVECSTDWFGDDNKLAKLVGRTNNLRRDLQATGGDEAPTVQPLVAIAKTRVDAPPALIEALSRHKVGLLAADDIDDLVLLVGSGASDSDSTARLARCLPAERDWEIKVSARWQPPLEDWSL